MRKQLAMTPSSGNAKDNQLSLLKDFSNVREEERDM
jgi:hypothetical protein